VIYRCPHVRSENHSRLVRADILGVYASIGCRGLAEFFLAQLLVAGAPAANGIRGQLVGRHLRNHPEREQVPSGGLIVLSTIRSREVPAYLSSLEISSAAWSKSPLSASTAHALAEYAARAAPRSIRSFLRALSRKAERVSSCLDSSRNRSKHGASDSDLELSVGFLSLTSFFSQGVERLVTFRRLSLPRSTQASWYLAWSSSR